MTLSNPFDPGRDEALGRLMADALDPGDHGRFAARVRAALPELDADSPWEVLARWARPGIAAAAVLLVASLAGWLALGRPGHPAVAEAPSRVGEPAEGLFAASEAPSHDGVLAAVHGADR